MLPELIDLIKSLPPSAFPLNARWLVGIDGAGSQCVADQHSRIGIFQGNRIAAHAVFRDLTTSTGDTLYVNPHVSSVYGTRPIGLFPAKEDRPFMKKLMDTLDPETIGVNEHAIWITISDVLSFKVNE
jgi:hypothetical protein